MFQIWNYLEHCYQFIWYVYTARGESQGTDILVHGINGLIFWAFPCNGHICMSELGAYMSKLKLGIHITVNVECLAGLKFYGLKRTTQVYCKKISTSLIQYKFNIALLGNAPWYYLPMKHFMGWKVQLSEIFHFKVFLGTSLLVSKQ